MKESKRSHLDFGDAIKLVKLGKKLQREGWNGKNQYIELATTVAFQRPDGNVIGVNHDAMGSKAIAFYGTSGIQLGWLASQADMLAEDWMLVN